MANIEVKNIPEKLHNQLCRYARQQECTLGDFVLEAIERESLGGNGTGVSPPGRRPGLALQRRSCSMRNAGSVAVSYREPLRHRCVGSYEYLLRKPLGLILADILEDATLLAPELLDVEVMSVLRRAVLRGELFDQRAALALDDLTDWGVDRIPHLRLLRLA